METSKRLKTLVVNMRLLLASYNNMFSACNSRGNYTYILLSFSLDAVQSSQYKACSRAHADAGDVRVEDPVVRVDRCEIPHCLVSGIRCLRHLDTYKELLQLDPP